MSYLLFGDDEPFISSTEILLPQQVTHTFLCQAARLPFLEGLHHGRALIQSAVSDVWRPVKEGEYFEMVLTPGLTGLYTPRDGRTLEPQSCRQFRPSAHPPETFDECDEVDDKECLRLGLQCFVEEQEDSIALYTHGLLQEGLGQRVGDLNDLTPSGVYRLTHQLWPEHKDRDLWLVVVRPQARILPAHPQLHIIAEFTSQYVRRPPLSCPILVESWFWDHRLIARTHWRAHYMECTCNKEDFQRVLVRDDLHLDIWIEDRHLHVHETAKVRPGSLVKVSMEPSRLPELRQHQGLRNAVDLPRLIRAARHVQRGIPLNIVFHGYNGNGTTRGSKKAIVDGIQAIDPQHIIERAKAAWAETPIEQVWLVPDPAFGVAGELHVLAGPQVHFGTPILCAVDIRDANQGRITPRYVPIVVPWHFTDDDFRHALQLEALHFPHDSELQLVQHASLPEPIRRLSQGQSPYLIINVPSTAEWLERRHHQMQEDTEIDVEDEHALLQLGNSRKVNKADKPIPLSLQAALGSVEDTSRENLETQKDGDPSLDFSAIYDGFQCFDAHCIFPCFLTTPALGWHPQSYPWLDLEWWDPTTGLEEIHIYTDGSECNAGTGAAFCAFGWTGLHWVLVGFFSQQLAADQQAHHAEDFALLAAFKAIIYDICKMQHYQGLNLPARLVCNFDSTSAGGKAFGYFSAHTNHKVAHSSRAILHLLHSAFKIRVSGFHVRGHTGNPGNEIANTLAEEAARGRPTHAIDQMLHECAKDCLQSALPWFWALFHDSFAALWHGTQLCLPSQALRTTPAECIPSLPKTVDHNLAAACLELTVATINVLTLKATGSSCPALEGLGTSGRQELLFAQLHEAGVHLCACQETRLRRGPKRNQWFFFKHSAANEKGQYGISVAFNTARPIGHEEGAAGQKSTPIFWREEHVSVVAKDPRFLILRLTNPICRAIVVAAHAPHSGTAEVDIENWWDRCHKAIPSDLQAWPVILLCDANAHVGSQTSTAVGPWQAEEEGPKSRHFHNAVLGWNVFLPSTFEQTHHGEAGTWFHKQTKKWKRGDYIGLPASWVFTRCSSTTRPDIDLGHGTPDHCAVLASFTCNTTARGRKHPWPPKLVEDTLTQALDSDNRLLLNQHLQAALSNVWEDDVHRHEARLQEALTNFLWSLPVRSHTHKRKTHLSDDTWDLVTQKKLQYQHWRSSLRQQRQWTLQGLFAVWASHTRDPVKTPIWSDALQAADRMDVIIAKDYWELQRLARLVTTKIRGDDKNFFKELAERAGQCDDLKDVRGLWKEIKRVMPKHAIKRMADNPLGEVVLETQWEPYFCDLEAGRAAALANIYQDCKDFQIENVWRIDPPTLQDIPTRSEVEDSLRATKRGRSTGNDPVPAGVVTTCAPELGGFVTELLLKIFWWQQEPFAWKGGAMIPLFKRGQMDRAENYRGIMLLPTLAKRFHSMLRTRLLPYLVKNKPQGLLGGLPHQEVAYGSMAVRAFNTVAHTRGWSHATLYIDLRNAFHHLVRELLLGVVDPDGFHEVLCTILKQKGETQAVQHLSEEGIFKQFGVPAALQRLLADVHTGTWCQIGNTQRTMRTNRGSRPGSPLADMVYHFLMAAVQRDIEAALHERAAFQEMIDHLHIQATPITWADDLAIPWATSKPEELLKEVHDITGIVYMHFKARGMTLNFQPGKTSAVVTLQGAGAGALRKSHLLGIRPGIDIVTDDGSNIWLPFVPTYKHLGVQVSSDLNIVHEVRHRIGQARQALATIRHKIIKNKRLKKETRLRLADALILTKLYFGMGALPNLGPRLLQQVTGFVAQVYRDVLDAPLWAEDAVDNERFFMENRLIPPRVRITKDRLCLAARLFRHGPSFLVDMLVEEKATCDESWLQALELDIKWLHEITPEDTQHDFQGGSPGWMDLQQVWSKDLARWKIRVRKALRKHTEQEHCMATVFHWHQRIFRLLQGGGYGFSPDPCAHGTVAFGPANLRCHCGRTFTTPQGLQLHKAKQHKEFSLEHQYVTGATCDVCRRHFWTSQRLQQHLAYMPRAGTANACYVELVRRGATPEAFARVTMPADKTGLNRREAILTAGPDGNGYVQSAQERQSHQLKADIATLEQSLDELNFRITLEQADLNKFWDELEHVTNVWFRNFQEVPITSDLAIEQLIDAWIEVIYGDAQSTEDIRPGNVQGFLVWGECRLVDTTNEWFDGEAETVADKAFAEACKLIPGYTEWCDLGKLEKKLIRLAHASELPPKPHRPVRTDVQEHRGRRKAPPILSFFDQQADWTEELRQVQCTIWPTAEPGFPLVRQPSGKPYHIVVHLFSGRRRAGDFHDTLQRLLANHDGKLVVLSMDTAVSAEFGDLTVGKEPWQRLQALYEAGVVVATLVGAPCETWSEARNMPPPEDEPFPERWPRPLRTAAQPWGKHNLSMRELKQLQVGTALHLSTLWLILHHIIKGGIFLSEHPWEPQLPERVSSWTTPLMKLIRSLPEVKLWHLKQCYWGAASVKPTGLLTCRVPFLMKSFKVWKSEPAEISEPAIGKMPDGTFRTSALKEYPQEFCGGLAQVVADYILQKSPRNLAPAGICESQLPGATWIQEACTATRHIFRDQWLPDYQG